MNILGQSLTFNQTSNIGNQRFGEEVKLGTTDNSDVSLIANNVEFLTLDADSGELKLGDNITFTGVGESSKIPKYGWLAHVDDAVLIAIDASNHKLNLTFKPSDIQKIVFHFKLIEIVGSYSVQFGIKTGNTVNEQLYSSGLNSTYKLELTSSTITFQRDDLVITSRTISQTSSIFDIIVKMRSPSSGSRARFLITKLEIDGVDYYDIVEPLQNNNPEALRIGDLTLNTLDNKIEATQLEVGTIEAGDASNVITLKSTSVDSVALEGEGTLESQWNVPDEAGVSSAFSENGQVETLTFTQNYAGVIINNGPAILSTSDSATELGITFKSVSTANDTTPFHGLGIGRLVTGVPPLGDTPDELFDDWFMLYKIKGNNKNPTKSGSPLGGSVRDETEGKGRDLAWYPIGSTYQIRLTVEDGRAYLGAVKTAGGVNTFPTYWYSVDLTLSPGVWVVFYYGVVAGTLSTRVHHSAESKDVVIAGWPINETLTELTASKPLLSETLILPEDELTLETPITIVEKNSCTLPSFTKYGSQTFRKTIINNWSSPEFKTLETEINPTNTEPAPLIKYAGAGISLTESNTRFTKSTAQLKASVFTEPLDFSKYEYDIEFEITAQFNGGHHHFILCENAYDINSYRDNGQTTDFGPQLQLEDGSSGADGGFAYYGKGFQARIHLVGQPDSWIRSTDTSANIDWTTQIDLVGDTYKYVIRKLPSDPTKLYIKEFYRNDVKKESPPEISWDIENGIFRAGYLDVNATQTGAGGARFNITKTYLSPEDLQGAGVADTVYTEEGDLWAVGGITTANGEVVGNLAKFTQGNWEPVNLGDGPSFNFGIGTPQVLFWDDRKLYIGGDHAQVSIGGTSTATYGWSIYDEQDDTWTLANQNMVGAIKTINKVGGVLYLAGSFTTIHNNSAQRIAEYNNGSWTRPDGVNGVILCSAQMGEVIYYGGSFTASTTGTTLSRCCEYLYTTGGNGAFFPLGLGVNADVYAMAASGTDLYLGGDFTQAQTSTKTIPTTYFTKFDTLTGDYYPYTGLDGAVRSIRVLGDDLVLIAGDFTTPSNKLCLLKGRQFKRLNGLTSASIVKPYGEDSVVFSPGLEGLIKSISSSVDVSFPDGHVELLSLGEKKDYIVVSTDEWV